MRVNLFTPDEGLGVKKNKGAKPRAQSLARNGITAAAQGSDFPNLPDVVGSNRIQFN